MYWIQSLNIGLQKRPETSKDIVSVVIASDNNYAPHLGALIASIIDNFSKERFLDLIILDGGISDSSKDFLRKLMSQKFKYSILRIEF